jgi:L-methionine (R)-S-oxide reductase
MEAEPTGRSSRESAMASPDVYTHLCAEARRIAAQESDLSRRLAPLCDALWDALSPLGVSWIGFYLAEADRGSEGKTGELVLAARRDKPACSPIGMHGACGQSFLEQSIRLIEDVELLGAGYIACDPRDRSEVVLPIYRSGAIWGVLDADSHRTACFREADAQGLAAVLAAAGLLDRSPPLRANRLQDRAGTV